MKSNLQKTLDHGAAPLGQKSPYPELYDKSLLFPVSRKLQRDAMGFAPSIEFLGVDIWNCYELAWLNESGKPIRATASFAIPASSSYLLESKSVKLYLNSLNNHRFKDENEVKELIEKDFSLLTECPVIVSLNPAKLGVISNSINYYCLDELNVKINAYQRDPDLLITEKERVEERVCTYLFKSHCLVTGQPDWGSIFIEYTGQRIERESLLAYLVSYYQHVGFSENCIEQIYVDLLAKASFERLLVYGRFTRRGGIEVNPYRQNVEGPIPEHRLVIQ
jgi:7-cyano-7-deazaguanine reductase